MNDEKKYFSYKKELEKISDHYLKFHIGANSNPTNGDMLQALFEGLDVEFSDYAPLVNTNLDGSLVSFLADWWNAPYTGKGGGR